jgi:hypothetical protein
LKNNFIQSAFAQAPHFSSLAQVATRSLNPIQNIRNKFRIKIITNRDSATTARKSKGNLQSGFLSYLQSDFHSHFFESEQFVYVRATVIAGVGF